jgi:hypothetical protein
MAELEPQQARGLAARPDRPLIGIPVREGGREAVRYFTDEAAADAAVTDAAVEEALGLAGAWSDLDWEDLATVLDRIRHESKPTPPIELDP